MANASKRVQVGFKSDVLDALEQLSTQSGESLSKVVSRLVEQSLVNRGLLEDSALNPVGKSSSVVDMAAAMGYSVETVQKKTESLEDDDLKLLKKLKMLKELGIFT